MPYGRPGAQEVTHIWGLAVPVISLLSQGRVFLAYMELLCVPHSHPLVVVVVLNLFIWLCQVLVEARQHAGSFIAAHGLFVVARRLLSNCGARAPESTGSVVAVHGLSCPAACGILVPQPRIEPASPAMEVRYFFF